MIREILGCLVLGGVVTAFALASEVRFAIGVNVAGAEPGIGQVLVSLFDSSESFLVTPLLEVKADVNSEGNAFVSLGAQAKGEYAIAVIYDKNKNGKLDTGWFRIPKEEIGFSNNAKARLGPAKWDDARFLVTDSDADIDIQLAKADR